MKKIAANTAKKLQFCQSLTSGQHVPCDGVGDGGEDPVELSERRTSVVEPARDPGAQHNTDGTVSAALAVCHGVYSQDELATTPDDYNTS